MTTTEIAQKIEDNAKNIIDNLSNESVEVYKFLKDEFQKENVKENYLFQFVFRSFYRLDNAGLTDEFKTTYFELLEYYRNQSIIDIKEVLEKFYVKKNHKGQSTLQFSFVTKLLNTINDSIPIYDSQVSKLFSMSRPTCKDFAKSIDTYLDYLETIQVAYNKIINDNLLPESISLFNTKFKDNNLSDIKKIDFIFWSAGKLEIKKEKEGKAVRQT